MYARNSEQTDKTIIWVPSGFKREPIAQTPKFQEKFQGEFQEGFLSSRKGYSLKRGKGGLIQEYTFNI